MVELSKQLVGGRDPFVRTSLQRRSATLLHFRLALGQSGKERIQLLPRLGRGAKADVGRHLFPCPTPDHLVCVKVRTIRRQGDKSQLEVGRRKIFPHLGATVCRTVIPDHHQGLAVIPAQLLQKIDRRRRRAGLGHGHELHFPRFQANARVVGRFFAQPGTRRVDQRWLAAQDPLGSQISIGPKVGFIHEEDLGSVDLRFDTQRSVISNKGLPLHRIGLDQSLLGPLGHKAQPMQVVVATAATESPTKTLLRKQAHTLPVPVRHIDAYRCRRSLHRGLQLRLLRRAEGGGGPPACSKARPAGPFWSNASTQSPIVWASRSKASATWTADQPRARSQMACQRSRSRGVGARYIWFRTDLRSTCHWPSIVVTSFTAEHLLIGALPVVYHICSAGFILALV